MAAAAPGRRHVCVVLHDVAPARWAACRRVLAQAEAVAAQAGVVLPVTLLVVPRFHGRDDTPPHYLRWLHRLARLGHELALHGFTHRDPGAPHGLRDTLLRRHYTAGEGEFAGLSRDEAERRLVAARRWAAAHALPVRGFVAPAWLMNDAAREAVGHAGFDYTCTLTRVIALPDGEALQATGLAFSTRSAWRRLLSIAWASWLARVQQGAPLLRLELHPDDADHPAVRRCWSRVLARALREREPVRLAEAAALARRAPAARA